MSAGSMSTPVPPWLVVVDMQTAFADPASPWATPGFGAIVPRVRRLVQAHRPSVVLTRFVAPTVPSGSWVPYSEQWPFALVPDEDPLYAIVPDLAAEGLPVVTRSTFGKWDAELAGLVDPDATVRFAGVSTDCCVLSTALSAADDGRTVQVLADACAGASDADHRRALDAMALYAPLIEISAASAVLGPDAR